jgi:hypothetical protein
MVAAIHGSPACPLDTLPRARRGDDAINQRAPSGPSTAEAIETEIASKRERPLNDRRAFADIRLGYFVLPDLVKTRC